MSGGEEPALAIVRAHPVDGQAVGIVVDHHTGDAGRQERLDVAGVDIAGEQQTLRLPTVDDQRQFVCVQVGSVIAAVVAPAVVAG